MINGLIHLKWKKIWHKQPKFTPQKIEKVQTNPKKTYKILNIYVQNIRAPKYIKQMLIKLRGEIDNDAGIVGNFNFPLSTMGHYSDSNQHRL